jgi:hypothetical protein
VMMECIATVILTKAKNNKRKRKDCFLIGNNFFMVSKLTRFQKRLLVNWFFVVQTDTVSFSLPAVAESSYFSISTFPHLRKALIFQFQPSSNCWRALFFDFNLPVTAGEHYFSISTFQ